MKKIILLFVFMCASAFASAQNYYNWAKGSSPNYEPSGSFSSPAEACTSAYAPSSPESNDYTLTSIRCMVNTSFTGWMALRLKTCNSSGQLVGTTCVAAPVCTAGKTYEITVRSGYTNDSQGLPTNYGGCSVDVVSVIKCYSEGVDSTGKTPAYCTFQVKESGIAAPSGATAPVNDVPAADAKTEKVPTFNPAQGQGCPAGTVSLGIDSTGGSICGGSGTSPTAPTKTEVKEPATTVTNPDGSTDRVDISHRTNSDGSITTTTKTTTTGADGKVTVKEVTVTGAKPAASGGGSGVSDAKDEDKTDLCKLHPELNVCKNSEVTGGGCSGGVDSTACTGDAIQCAILRQQKKEYCEWNKENPSATLGNLAVAGNDPLKGTLPTKENASTLNMQSLDQNGFLGGGSCFADKSITVQGIAINLPFSKLCPYLEWLRYVIMIIAALVSFKIISKPVLGE